MKFFFKVKPQILILLKFMACSGELLHAAPLDSRPSKYSEISRNEWIELINLPTSKAKNIWVQNFKGSFSNMNWTWRLGFINVCFKEDSKMDYIEIVKTNSWCEEVLIQGLKNRAVVVKSHSLRKLGKLEFSGKIPEKILNIMIENSKDMQHEKLGQKSFFLHNYLYAAKRSKNEALIQEGKKIVNANPAYKEYWHKL